MSVFFIVVGIILALLGTDTSLIVGTVLIGTGSIHHAIKKLENKLDS